ncbi:Ig-like domain-containing protein [Pararhodobacter zhoushanensis]|uniref:Ig-like domain-containing protein n=1 Tax=Pararhodobacter zhoushanensis TaxID=2479545 RepID=A0ABT3GW20_9RHOB|nr:Ig-like domain-containing protein [Pararhodobacter zhoushanensis]MCW1931742.1 Ig-like domain-containing protein [Pararhodobacter zhoushanensis]
MGRSSNVSPLSPPDIASGFGAFYVPVSINMAADPDCVPAPAQIEILGTDSSVIANGETTTSTIDGTDFGDVATEGASVTRTFQIRNAGAMNLNINSVGVTGPFFVGISSATAAPGLTDFTIRFDPSSAGAASGTVTFQTDAGTDPSYTFAVSGTGIVPSEPELAVYGLSGGVTVLIPDGSPSASSALGTVYDQQDHTTGSENRTFRLFNSGTDTLNISSVTVTSGSGFSVLNFPSSVGVGGIATTGIRFDPPSIGVFSAIVTVVSDDPDSPYTFAVGGEGVDTSPPTATLSALQSPAGNGVYTSQVTFSEPVTGFTATDLTLLNATATVTAVSTTVYGVVLTAVAAGTVSYAIPAAAAQDGASFGNVAAGPVTATFAGVPGIEIRGNGQLIAPGATTPVTANGTDLGAIESPGSATQDFVVTNPGTRTLTISGIEDGSSYYSVSPQTFTVAPGASETFTVTYEPVLLGTHTSVIQVASDAPAQSTYYFYMRARSVDTTAPTAGFSPLVGPDSGVFTTTLTFSEPVIGFSLSDLTLVNATATMTGTDAVYEITLTPQADGTVSVALPAAVAKDAAGNDNTAAASVSADYDATAPSVTITGVPALTSAPFTATFTFSEAVTGFAAGDITVTNAAVSGFSASSSTVYTALITPTADGPVTLDVAAAVAEDAGGNGNTAAVQAVSEYDATAPSVTITGVPTLSSAPFTATFTFSEAVTGFAAGDITVTNAAVSGFAASSSTVYTALITPTADGPVTLDVAAAVAEDAGGNGNTAATQASSQYDATAPSITITGVPTLSSAPFTATFTFSEAVTGFAAGDIVVSNASVSGFAASSSTVYTALITPTADGPVTLDVAADVAEDAGGNGNTAAVQAVSDYDATAPSVTITGVPALTSAPFTATFTFSEAVTGFAAGDIVVTNASVSGFAASSSTVYTALITPTADGPVTLDVAADVAEDAGGNGNSAAVQAVSEYDATAPSVSITGVPTLSSAPFTATFTFSEAVTGFAAGDITVSNASVSGFAASSSTVYTALISPTADGPVTLDVAADVAEDSTGNGNTAAVQAVSEYDATAPSVTITGVPTLSSAPFTATFTFSEAVTGFAAGDIVVSNAAVSGFAASSSTVYTALITPTADGPVTLDVAADVAEDAGGNGNTAAVQAGSQYDATAPSVAITGVPTLSSAPFTATFTFSEAVTGFAAGDITVTNAAVSGFAASSSTVYTALISPTADGPVTLDVAAAVAEDAGGNGNTAAVQAVSEYDATAPSVTITGVPALSSAAFTATFTFSEAVTGFAAGDIVVSNAAVSGFAASSSTVYTALITPTADGPVTLDVAAEVAEDAGGNGNTAATQASSQYDATAPSVTITGVPALSSAPFTATFTFSEAVTGFVAGDIVVSNASVSGFAASSSTVYTALITPTADGPVTLDVAAAVAEDAGGNGNTAAVQASSEYDATAPSVAITGVPALSSAAFTATFTFSEAVTGFAAGDITVTNAAVSGFAASSSTVYTALITPAADGPVTLDVAAAAAEDAGGNGNTAAVQAVSEYDATAPSVTITGVPTLSSAPFTATFTFSEAVTGFAAGDIMVANASVSGFAASSSTVYTALISPTADGTVTLDVAAAVAEDAGGNGNTAATQASSQYDATAPSITITGVPTLSSAPFTATFTFSEAVTGFAAGDIMVANASVSGFAASSSTVYTALISPTADGPVTLDVAAAAAEDAGGNGNTAAVQAVSEYDATAPSVTITGVPALTSAPFTATFTFSEAVTGFVAGDIMVSNASVSGFAASSSTVYTALITPTADGPVTLDVAADVAEDAGGNGNTAATQASSQYDATAPSVAITGVPALTSAPFTATFTFSEAVTGFAAGDIVVSNASVSGFSASSSTVYTALITPTADGPVTLDVAAAVAEDAGGNGNTAAVQASSQYDATAPSVTITGVPALSSAPFTATFTFSEAVTGFAAGDITVTNAAVSGFSASSSTVYTALITPTADGPVTLDVAAAVAEDAGGNGNTAAVQAVSEYDATAPSVSITGVPALSSAPFTATFTFSEAVTGFAAGDIMVSNAAVSGFAASSSTVYTALITPTADGPVTLDVAAAVAEDAGGNGNTAAVQASSEYDATAPSVTISDFTGPQGGTFSAEITLSEAADDFALGDIALENATGVLSGTGTGYTLVVTPLAAGTVSAQVTAGSFTDAAGNANAAASNRVSFTHDPVAPTVAIVDLPDEFAGAASFSVTILFSEDVTGFAPEGIIAQNASITALSGSGTRYAATIRATGAGDVVLRIAAGAARDAAGNASLASDAVRITNRTVAETQGQITRFMLHRAVQLVSNQPGLICLMQGTCAGGC